MRPSLLTPQYRSTCLLGLCCIFINLLTPSHLPVAASGLTVKPPISLRHLGLRGGLRSPSTEAVKFTDDEKEDLLWNYLAEEKYIPYVGHYEYASLFPTFGPRRVNSLAVFPGIQQYRMHGVVGVYPNGTAAYHPGPTPPPAEKVGLTNALANGGFYLNLSNALPLDRDPRDEREGVCKREQYDLSKLDDVSVVITFYNEPISTLMRSVHSVLNRTPPPLLREIILVDDHSNLTENGDYLNEYIRLLPKVKLMRLPERRGLVIARLAGAKIAKAPILVVLDSHIEVNDGWLEPQVERLKESPESIVFPQILSIDSEDFSFKNKQGIGCFVTFKWSMQEKSSLTGAVSSTKALPSPSMAGGLFAVRLEWFWELGGYDEEFSMWGAENVEMGFRTWMCGGKLECTPCARVFHIYRKKGAGYSSPPQSLWKNRLRTARVWTDEWYQIAERYVHHAGFDIGSIDKMLELKERLKCKPFSWFLTHVDPKHEIRNMSQIHAMGEFRNQGFENLCLDTLGHSQADETYGAFYCHGGGGTQGFLMAQAEGVIRTFTDEWKCLGRSGKLTGCQSPSEDLHWKAASDGTLRWKAGTKSEECVALKKEEVVAGKTKPSFDFSVVLEKCDPQEKRQLWKYGTFKQDPNFKLPTYSEAYLKLKRLSAGVGPPNVAAPANIF